MVDEGLKADFHRRYGFSLPDDLWEMWPHRLLEDRELALFLAKVVPFRRPSWEPVVEKGDGPRAASKYGGLPWLSADEDWPRCPSCDGPLQFFLQLNLDEMQDTTGQYGTGLPQLFYCTNSETLCWDSGKGAASPFHESVLTRVVHSIGVPRPVVPPEFEEAVAPQAIVRWAATGDYPSFHGLKALGVALDKQEREIHRSFERPLIADKLGGWPCHESLSPRDPTKWNLAANDPRCTQCHKPMDLVFQLVQGGNLDYGIASSYIGHVTQCPDHKQVVAFSWECD